MKRIFACILALMVLLSFAACGSSAPASNGDSGSTSGATTDATTEATTEETTEAPADEIDFEELTVVDNDACLIKITGIEEDPIWGYTLKAYLENKSADKTYMFSVESASINGVSADPFFAAEVASGKKANEDISFSDTELEELIGSYTDIALSFRVYDSEDWLADPVAEASVHVYPYGEDKAVTYTREAQESDVILVDNEHVTAILTGYEQDEIWGYTANLFLVNKTDVEVMFSAEDVSVNGFMADPYFATSVTAGTCAFSSMSWDDETFEENSITEVEEIEMTVTASNNEDWLAEDFASETVTLNP